MNYERIYSEFIADRMGRPTSGYVERHHVLPRSLGGGDEATNIVELSPEDHFFAHLMLAKIYGAGQWRAVLIMASKAPTRSGVTAAMVARMRRHYGAARRALSREGNNKFNPTVFEWVNLDTGDQESLCLYDMHAKHGGGRGQWTCVINGYRKTYKGWTLKGREIRIRGSKGFKRKFVHRDGRTFEGTQKQFRDHAELNEASAWRVVHERSVTACGWRLEGVEDRNHNSPKNGDRPGKRGAEYKFVNGLSVREGDRVALAAEFGSTPGAISASVYAIRAGKIGHYKGWKLAESGCR